MAITTVQVLRNEYVPPSEIVLLRGETNYTALHFRNGRVLLLAKTLKRVQEDFEPHGFLRVNKSNVINGLYLASTSANYDSVLLDNNLELTVARRRRDDLREFVISKAIR